MRIRRMALAAAAPIVIGAASVAVTGGVGGHTIARAAGGPCGTTTTAPTYQHVIWVLMENHSYGDIIGNTSQAPYINTLAGECGLAMNYHNVDHPSLPNYVGMTSGLSYSQLKPFKSDCNPSKKCSTSSQSIMGQADAAGKTWKAYEESMTSNCERANDGEYAVRHNPGPYYTTLSDCSTNDVPYTQLSTDLANNTLPSFSFITPNLIDDMHDGTINQGDTWLSQNLPAIFNSTAYTSGTTTVVVTWDEGEGGTVNDCSQNTTDIGCHVATIVVSPSTAAGSTSGTLFNHYSLLGTTEDLLGLPRLGQATTPPNTTMTSAFNL